ncbi:MAG: transposase, partial [Chitinophagales bacterium]
MSEKYKVYDSTRPTFVTITVVGWVDVFTQNKYTEILDDAIQYCIKNKGLIVNAYVYMTNHIHLIARSDTALLQDIIRDFKKFTSKEMIIAIKEGIESRKEWMLNKFSFEAKRTNRTSSYKFWRDGFHPIELDATRLIEQKMNYIHQNPVKRGF